MISFSGGRLSLNLGVEELSETTFEFVVACMSLSFTNQNCETTF